MQMSGYANEGKKTTMKQMGWNPSCQKRYPLCYDLQWEWNSKLQILFEEKRVWIPHWASQLLRSAPEWWAPKICSFENEQRSCPRSLVIWKMTPKGLRVPNSFSAGSGAEAVTVIHTFYERLNIHLKVLAEGKASNLLQIEGHAWVLSGTKADGCHLLSLNNYYEQLHDNKLDNL